MVLMFTINSTIIRTTSVGWHNCEILIAGDSHTQRALNPKFLQSAINMSQVSEPYFITYWKLKKYLSQNITHKIILGFSYHNLSFNNNNLFDRSWADEMFKRIYSLSTISFNNDIGINKYEFYKIKLHNMCLYPNINPFYFKGGFSNSSYTNLSDSCVAIRRHYFYNNFKNSAANISMQYLDSIVSLCNKNKIKLILISTPLHYSYLNKIPNGFIKNYELIKEKLNKDSVVVLDFSHQKYPDKFYLNSDHLNSIGSEKFTKQVASIIKNISN